MKMNMKTTILTIVALLIVMALLAAGSLAWFYAGDNVNMCPAESQGQGSIQNVAANYFNGGDGTATDPFEIDNPVQMYNFAWLQYLGYFNQVDGNGNIVQTYFVLTADIDMTGYTLPPIGTATNPFLGNFNGGYHTISNLTVDNEISADGITDFPGMIEDNTAFQENGTVDIVGMFGVVGSIGETDYTYDSTANVIQNLYVDSITVKTKTDQSLIGIVAGYVNGTVQNVGVIGNTTINIATTTPLSYTNNMSDFSLVGYCTQAYRSQSNTVTLNGSLDDSGSGGSGSGSGIGWGGSIGINALYARLDTVYKKTASDTSRIDTYVSEETRTYNMFDNSVVLNSMGVTSSGGYNRTIRYRDYSVNGAYAIIQNAYTLSYYDVAGHRTASGGTNTVTLNAENAYWIFMGEGTSVQYLNRNSTAVTGGGIPTTMWALDTDGHLYTVEPGTDTKYYLSVDTNGASLVTTPSEANTWTLDESTHALKVNGATQYLSHDGTKWCLQTGTYAQANSQVTYEKTVTQGRDSYFPINAKEEDNFSISDNNTGYFVGGSHGSTAVDFRVAYYGLSDIYKAFGKTSQVTIDLEKDELQVYTRTATSGDNFCLIEDPSSLGLEKYDAAREQLETILANGNGNIYGLRFMQAEISKDRMITAPVVKINGKTTYNYEMPESCIDFQLAGKGKISFFAATVGGSPTYFLSLHEIIRNPDNTVKEIKKIQRIYQEGNSYIYEYIDGTFSGTKSDQATLAFDLDWIMNPMHTNSTSAPLELRSVYYFEIPVNAGEYALGAHTRSGTDGVKSSLSSYLLYLDIGANGDEGGGGSGGDSGTTIMSATVEQIIYPKGVDFLAGQTGLNDIQNSAAIRLPSGTTGDMSFSRAGDTITVDPSTGLQASYIKDGINVPNIKSPPIEETVYLKKVAQTTDGGVTTVTITKGSSAGNETDTVLIYSYTAGTATVSFSSDLTMPDDTSTWKYDLTITSTASIVVTVTELGDSGFAITINGEAITAPTTITVPSS